MANKPNPKKREETAAKIIEALKENHGLLTLAAKKAGVSYCTLCKYVKDYPSVAKALHEAKESLLDFAEGKLMEQMRSGNMTAIIFYLKTQGKGRGYVERQEVTGQEGKPLAVSINVVSDAAKKLTEEILQGKGT